MMRQLAQLTVNGLITGAILALTGVGASLVFGIQRIANFAHGEYLTFAAYAGLVLNVAWRQNLVVSTLGAMLLTGFLAIGIHLVVLKPLRGRGLVAISLITVGLGLILRDVVFLVAGPPRSVSTRSTRRPCSISGWCGSPPGRPWPSPSRR
jgi:neutral amino acid transport system permease protein